MVDSYKQAQAKVIYFENCEYNKSEITKKVTIPRQNVQVELSIENLNANTPKRQQQAYHGKNFYTDILRCTATVTLPTNSGNTGAPIKAGRIEFYYQLDDTNVRQPLNKSMNESPTCVLNNQGKAAIDIQPKASGDIIAVYVDDNDNYIQENEAIAHITLHDMPAFIHFTKTPAYIVSVEDEVELEVEVTDIDNNKLNYGLVTFLHYNIKDEDVLTGNPETRKETMIGNPVVVENGKANIKYIPVQTDNYDINHSYDLEPEHLDVYGEERYLERIRAVYNYDNKLYGRKWKYYTQVSDWANVAIARRNSLTIGIANSGVNIDLEHTYSESAINAVTIKGFIHDKNNENVKLTNEDVNNLMFHIKGTHTHPTSVPTLDNNTYAQNVKNIEYDNSLKYTNTITENGNTLYTLQLPHLLPGTYTITASIDAYNIDKQKDSYRNDNDIYYDIIDDSNELLINVSYDDISYSITANNITKKVKEKFNIEGIITINHNNNANTIKNILNGKQCYFFIPAIDKRIKGQITYQNGQLKCTSNNININISGEYDAYIYLAHGIYSSDLTTSSYHNNNIDFYLQHIEGQCTINIIEDVDITLKEVFTTFNSAPCQVEYEITGKNITREVSISLSYKNINSSDTNLISANIILTKNNPISKGIINTSLESGNYQLIATTNTNQVFKHEFTVNPGALTQKLVNNTVEMGLYKTIGVYLTSKNSLRNIDINKISAYTQKADTDYDINNATQVNIQNSKFIDDHTLYLNVFTNTSDIGKYWICLYYAGDNNIQPTSCQPSKFTTYVYAPVVSITTTSYGSYGIQVCYYDSNGNKQYPNDILLLEIVFHNIHQNVIKKGLLLTNKHGYGEIYTRGSDITKESWWNGWASISVIFRPSSPILINLINNNYDDAMTADAGYEYYFDLYNVTTSTQYETDLKSQLNNYDNKYIYGTLCRDCVKPIRRLNKA